MADGARRTATAPVVAAVAALTVALLGPALRPGYALIGDQVFVPDQSLLPWMVGLGGGLPRSVPQDAVVALLTGPVPGWVWEKVALVAALSVLGLGAARLVRPAGRGAALVAAVVAVWSPYVGERLLLGHWSLLLAVAMLPWALLAAAQARSGSRVAVARWLLLVAVASLTVSGGLLVLLLTLPVVAVGGDLPRGRRASAVVASLILQLPWVLPALLHPGTGAVGGADVFALRPEGRWGPLVTALGTGGVWNAAAVPGSRSTLLAPLVTVVLLVLAHLGRQRVLVVLGRPVTTVLVIGSALGLLVAVAGAWTPTAGVVGWWVENVPGGGLVRDGQKWLAPWLVLLAVSSALGAVRVAGAAGRRTRDSSVRRLVLVAVGVVALLAAPDLVWGSAGRLASVDYPDDWAQVREVLATDPAPGDVVSLPWSTFRRFDWNLGRTVLDPAPRAMPRTVVASDSLVVRHGDTLVTVPGDDPRSEVIGAAVGSGADLAPVLHDLGVGWVLVERAGAPPPTLPSGAVQVLTGPDLALYRLAAPTPAGPPSGVAAVVLGDAAAVLTVLLAAGALLRRRVRPRLRRPGKSRPEDGVREATGW
jgi:hypothetical protein